MRLQNIYRLPRRISGITNYVRGKWNMPKQLVSLSAYVCVILKRYIITVSVRVCACVFAKMSGLIIVAIKYNCIVYI